MNAFRRTLPAVSRAVVASAIALAAGASHAAVGAKLIIQGWEPWNDNRQPTVVPIDDPQLISRPLVEGWNMLRQPLCQMIESAIGQPDMIYRGITLYEIGCDIRPLDVSMVPVTPASFCFCRRLFGGVMNLTSLSAMDTPAVRAEV